VYGKKTQVRKSTNFDAGLYDITGFLWALITQHITTNARTEIWDGITTPLKALDRYFVWQISGSGLIPFLFKNMKLKCFLKNKERKQRGRVFILDSFRHNVKNEDLGCPKMYLCQRHTGKKLRDIGFHFGIEASGVF